MPARNRSAAQALGRTAAGAAAVMPWLATASGPRPSAAWPLARSVALHLAAGAVATAGLATALAAWAGSGAGGVAAALLIYAAVAAAALGNLDGHAPHRAFGPANRVTLLRGVLVAAIGVGLAGGPESPQPLLWALSGMALAALLLDGADGWLARRHGVATEYGQCFDMAIDTLAMGVLALLAWWTGKAGAWVLAIGLLRYLFVLAGMAWPVLAGALPFSQRRRAICVVQIAVLLACVTPLATASWSARAAAMALALLVYSFATDIFWLLTSSRRGHKTPARRVHGDVGTLPLNDAEQTSP